LSCATSRRPSQLAGSNAAPEVKTLWDRNYHFVLLATIGKEPYNIGEYAKAIKLLGDVTGIPAKGGGFYGGPLPSPETRESLAEWYCWFETCGACLACDVDRLGDGHLRRTAACTGCICMSPATPSVPPEIVRQKFEATPWRCDLEYRRAVGTLEGLTGLWANDNAGFFGRCPGKGLERSLRRWQKWFDRCAWCISVEKLATDSEALVRTSACNSCWPPEIDLEPVESPAFLEIPSDQH
jgi:hypothetical protein